MEDNDRFVDELLDSALARHRAAEPRPGLEARVLERIGSVAGERSTERKAWRLWLAVAATAAVIAMFVAIRVARRPRTPAAQTSQASGNAVPSPSHEERLTALSETPQAVSVTAATTPISATHHKWEIPRGIGTAQSPPSFRAPMALSKSREGEASIKFVRDASPLAFAAPAPSNDSTIQHIQVEPLKIPPLEIKPLEF